MNQEPAHKSGKPPRGPAGRLARWWRDFSDSVGKSDPAVVVIERFARTAWVFAKSVAAIPTLLLALPATALMLLGACIQRAGPIGKRAHWVLTGPALALLWIVDVVGWALVVLLVWRYLTDCALRTSVNDTAKFVASVAIMGGTIPMLQELYLRLDVRFSLWGLGERVSQKLALCIALVMWLILAGLLVYYGVVAPWP